jgi:hypothetical protein
MRDDDRSELISAALDAEPVDVEVLRRALATPEGRDALASFLMLRASVAADAVEPRTAAAAVMAAARANRRSWPLVLGWRVPLGAAASLAILLTAGAFWAGTAWRAGSPADGPGQAASQTAAARATSPASARRPAMRVEGTEDDIPPIPSRVLRFTPGVDWHEGS